MREIRWIAGAALVAIATAGCTSGGAPGASNRRRLAFSADLLPRTHWNVNIGYYLDHASGASASTVVTQLHLFL